MVVAISAAVGAVPALVARAQCDPLTGLPGRAAFHARLSAHCERLAPGSQLGLLLVDIDMLRLVNDTFGRDAGDTFLREFASKLAAAVGDEGTVARIEGDEFAVLLPHLTDADELAAWARRLCQLIRATCGANDSEVSLSASVGAAIAPDDAANAWALIQCADIAQFCAKSSGRDRALRYRPSLRAQLETRVQACAASGNFGLNYQPIVTIGGQPKLVGLECFLRWRHPTRGLLFPGDFRPVLEDGRVALVVGASVLDEATQQMRRWLDQGVAFGRVAVNVSAVQLRTADFVEQLLARLARHRINAGRLSLEISEDIYLADDIAAIARTLDRLRAAGVSLFVDGWAGGGASLETLRRLPIHGLKLDRILVQTLATEPLRALIAEARDMGVMVVAEGVETHDQLARLSSMGCPEAQGYLIARPMPAAKVPMFVQRLGTELRAAA